MPALGLEAAVEFIISESNLISNILDAITIVYHLALGSQPMFLGNT